LLSQSGTALRLGRLRQLESRVAHISLLAVLLTVVLAVGWLLPNHYQPWNTFHTNAWVAAALTCVALWRLASDPRPVGISRATVFLACLALIPWLQHWLGIVPLFSPALMDSLYLLGFATAFAVAEHWGRSRPGQPAFLVLLAACLSSLVSVGLQLYQWLGYAADMAATNIWVYPSIAAGRAYGNLAQPNQLASLLLLGLLGGGLAWHKKWLGRVPAVLVSLVILTGVALTQSRTALLTLTAGAVLLAVWRPAYIARATVRCVLLLYAYYLICLLGLGRVGEFLGLDATVTVLERSAGEMRLMLWRMALDASTERPWLGFGWNDTNEALLLVFPRHPQFANWYAEQSHNLLLDLVLWIGWPLAIVLTACCAAWLWRALRSIASAEQFLALSAMGVLLIHAMLELPLHHGYFLWPFAFLAGSVQAGLGAPAIASLARKAAFAILVVQGAFLGVIVRDYLHVEASFQELRFQMLRIGTGHNEQPPETLLLQDWADFMVMSRATPAPGMSPQEIDKWKELLLFNTSPLAFRKVIGALTLNGRPEEARQWAERSCIVLPDVLCKPLAHEWKAPAQPVPAPASK
jgi:hypothetical protein